MTRGFVFHVWTPGSRKRNILIHFDVKTKKRPVRSSLAEGNRRDDERHTNWMLRMWLDLLRWIVGGLMSSFSQFLPSCCTAQLQFQCTYYTCSIPYLPILWSSITSTVKALGERFLSFKAPFLFRSSGLWEKKIAVQTTDVRSDPRPPLPFFKEWYVPNPLTRLNKGDIPKEHWWSFFCSALLHVCWWKLPIPNHPLDCCLLWRRQW